jgi:hypothetical protein
MAKFYETYTYEGLEGKSWEEVKERVLEFKKALLEKGAPEVAVLEGGHGSNAGQYVMVLVFPSAAAWGAFNDSFEGDTAWEAKMAGWQSNPKLQGKSSSTYTEVS